MSGRWKILLRLGALLLALGFLGVLVSSQWQELQTYAWQLHPGWLVLSIMVLWLAWLVELSIWRFLLGRLGGYLRWDRAAQVWFLSSLARYIPGSFWQFLGMVELAADDGVSRMTTFASIALHQALSTAVGLVLAAIYFALAGQGAFLVALRPVWWLVPLGLLACHPRILEWTLNQVLRLLKRPPIHITLSWGQIWLVLVGYVLVWLLLGGAFSLLVASLLPTVAPSLVPALVAIWAAAYIVGYLSLLIPGGLGVREGLMVLLLAPLLAAPGPTVIALAARLWIVLGEVVAAGWAAALRLRQRADKAGCWSQAPGQPSPVLVEDGPA